MSLESCLLQPFLPRPPGCRATTKDAARLTLTKALKTGVGTTLHSAPQPPPGVDQISLAEAVKLREVVARGALEAQLARAQEGGGDAGQGGAAAAARVDAEEEAGRGGAEIAAQPDIEVDEGGANSAAQPKTGGGAGGEAQERPAGQRERGRPPPPGPRGPGSRVPWEWSRRRRWKRPASRSPRGSGTRVLLQRG